MIFCPKSPGPALFLSMARICNIFLLKQGICERFFGEHTLSVDPSIGCRRDLDIICILSNKDKNWRQGKTAKAKRRRRDSALQLTASWTPTFSVTPSSQSMPFRPKMVDGRGSSPLKTLAHPPNPKHITD